MYRPLRQEQAQPVSDETTQTLNVQSIITNVSLIGDVIKSPTVQEFVKRFGSKFITPALKMRAKDAELNVADLLARTGGIVGWACKSSTVQMALSHLDTILDSGHVTPEMAMEILEQPELLKELINLGK